MKQYLILCCLLLATIAHAQTATPDFAGDAYHNKKTKGHAMMLSLVAYSSVKEEYMAYDAWKDGYITDGQKFTIIYDRGKTIINGKPLPAAVASDYASKANLFFDKFTPRIPDHVRQFSLVVPPIRVTRITGYDKRSPISVKRAYK